MDIVCNNTNLLFVRHSVMWTQVSKSLWQKKNHPAYCVICQLQQGNVNSPNNLTWKPYGSTK